MENQKVKPFSIENFKELRYFEPFGSYWHFIDFI